MSDNETLSLLKSIDKRLSRLENKRNFDAADLPFQNEMSIFTDSVDDFLNPASEKGSSNLRKLEIIKELVDNLGDEDNLRAVIDLSKSLKDIAYLTSHLRPNKVFFVGHLHI